MDYSRKEGTEKEIRKRLENGKGEREKEGNRERDGRKRKNQGMKKKGTVGEEEKGQGASLILSRNISTQAVCPMDRQNGGLPSLRQA